MIVLPATPSGDGIGGSTNPTYTHNDNRANREDPSSSCTDIVLLLDTIDSVLALLEASNELLL